MANMEILFAVIAGFYLVWIIMSAIYFFGGNLDALHHLLNPIQVYRRNNVNWFGCFCLTILANVLWAPYAICYWFYKLCTVGRK